MRDRIRIGMIGCGRAAENLHLPALSKLPQARVVALADNEPGRLQRAAASFGVEHQYRSHQELLAQAHVDVAAICVPAQFHVPVALEALEAGKHIFIEKPLALHLSEADALIERAHDVPSKIMVGFNLRHHRLIREARRILQDDALGKIEAIRSSWTSAIRYRQETPAWRDSKALGGGALFEIAVHHFDLWRFLLQSEIGQVQAFTSTTQGPEETVTIAGQMTNGVTVSGLFSEHTSDHNELEIFGRRGRLQISLYQFDGLTFHPLLSMPGGLGGRVVAFKNLLKSLPKGLSIARQGGDYLVSYQSEWRQFIDAIQKDKPVSCSLEDGRKALQIVLAADKSICERQPVALDDLARYVKSAAELQVTTPIETRERLGLQSKP